jgi:hypothetical protein
LREHLLQHETFTAAYMGWAGLKNGELLDVAGAGGFDVLITGDRTLPYEQNLSSPKLALKPMSQRSRMRLPVQSLDLSLQLMSGSSAKREAEGGGDVKQLRTSKRSKLIAAGWRRGGDSNPR